MVKSTAKTHFMILCLVLAVTVTAEASTRTVAEYQVRIARDQATLKLHQSSQVLSTPTFLDITKNADGSVKSMNQADAIQYCSAQGAHLPSVREWAQLSMSLGAKGIAEIASGGPDDSYYLINAINADGTSDSFFYSHAGYQPPAGEFGNNVFWSSSSVGLDNPDFSFVFYSYNGVVYEAGPGSGNAVRCVSGR